jgi:hypothetical protein
MKAWHEMTREEKRAHIMTPYHDCEKCAVCLNELQRKGYTRLITIVNVRKPEKDIIQNVSDLIAAI